MPLYIRLELLSAHPCTISTQRCYILVISCALVVYLIYTPSAIPTLARQFVLPIIIAAKVGITSCQRICFIYACMDVTTQLEWCLHEHTQIVYSQFCLQSRQPAISQICSVQLVSQLLVFLLFIVILTFFLNF